MIGCKYNHEVTLKADEIALLKQLLENLKTNDEVIKEIRISVYDKLDAIH